MKVERADISQLLQQMKQVQNQIGNQNGIRESAVTQGLGAPQGLNGAQAADKTQGFGDMFKQAINSVNDTQQQAASLSTAYEKGDPKVSLAQVMVASQKASVSFQAITQVRNKLVEAYQDIMNMPM